MTRSTMHQGLKGLVITPPVIGRISIGRTIEKDGKRLPEKDDQFTITTQVQDRDGWRLHPIDEVLRKEAGGKLRNIPVTLLFNDPALNLRSAYTMFDRKTGRPTCTGNGEECRRLTMDGMKNLPCLGPDQCEVGVAGNCKPYGRLNVLIGMDDPAGDAMGTFIFRTTGYNSIRTLSARLAYFSAVSGGLLACMPLELKLRGKSTAQSYGRPVYYVDLIVRTGLTMEQAIRQGRELDASRKASGFDQTALDQAARLGFECGVFEDGEEDGTSVVEEFFPVADGAPLNPIEPSSTQTRPPRAAPADARPAGRQPLREKLSGQASDKAEVAS